MQFGVYKAPNAVWPGSLQEIINFSSFNDVKTALKEALLTGAPILSSVTILALMKNESPCKLLYIAEIEEGISPSVIHGDLGVLTTIRSSIEFSTISVKTAYLVS